MRVVLPTHFGGQWLQSPLLDGLFSEYVLLGLSINIFCLLIVNGDTRSCMMLLLNQLLATSSPQQAQWLTSDSNEALYEALYKAPLTRETRLYSLILIKLTHPSYYTAPSDLQIPLLFKKRNGQGASSLLSNNDPVFLHPAFCNPYFGPFFKKFQTLNNIRPT